MTLSLLDRVDQVLSWVEKNLTLSVKILLSFLAAGAFLFLCHIVGVSVGYLYSYAADGPGMDNWKKVIYLATLIIPSLLFGGMLEYSKRKLPNKDHFQVCKLSITIGLTAWLLVPIGMNFLSIGFTYLDITSFGEWFYSHRYDMMAWIIMGVVLIVSITVNTQKLLSGLNSKTPVKDTKPTN